MAGNCEVEAEGAVSSRVAQYWFKKFNGGETDIGDSPRSDRSTKVDSEALREAIEGNLSTSTCRFSEFDIPRTSSSRSW